MFTILLILHILQNGNIGMSAASSDNIQTINPGLQGAGQLILEGLKSHKPTRDKVLQGLVGKWEEAAYRLQVLRMRIGYAWELVFTDYGFKKQSSGIDLVSHRRKIVIELKNGYRINSIVRNADFRRLQAYKRRHPQYTAILGIINDKNPEGKSRTKNGLRIMSGQKFLHYILQGNEGRIILYLRRVVKRFMNRYETHK